MPFVELFASRRAAGRALASTLTERGDRLSVVVGLTRGGVPVAFEVASSLKLPRDVLVVKKLRAPVSAERAIGAVCADGTHVLRTEVVRELGVNGAYIARELETRLAEAQETERLYRGDLPPVDLAGASVAVVDDGLATGATMEAAVRSVRRRGARTVVVAVPVGSWAATHNIGLVAHAVVCLIKPLEFWSVSQFYLDFPQVSDDEVRRLLDENRAERATEGKRRRRSAAP